MAKYIKLKRRPAGKTWKFVGGTIGLAFYENERGKRYAQDDAGNWYRIA